jgi:hypothetical protein
MRYALLLLSTRAPTTIFVIDFTGWSIIYSVNTKVVVRASNKILVLEIQKSDQVSALSNDFLEKI